MRFPPTCDNVNHMENQPADPYVVTYIFEEPSDASVKWHTLEQGASFAAQISAKWVSKNREKLGEPAFTQWLSSGYRKHARRAKTKDFEAAVELLESTPLEGVVLHTPNGRIFVSLPLLNSEIPSKVKKLQMSNFKVSEVPYSANYSPVVVIVNAELNMSFGKAVIAAAHASQLLILEEIPKNDKILSEWELLNFANEVRVDSLPSDLVEHYYAVVRDFGLTEVPEGSITATAHVRPEYLEGNPQ